MTSHGWLIGASLLPATRHALRVTVRTASESVLLTEKTSFIIIIISMYTY